MAIRMVFATDGFFAAFGGGGLVWYIVRCLRGGGLMWRIVRYLVSAVWTECRNVIKRFSAFCTKHFFLHFAVSGCCSRRSALGGGASPSPKSFLDRRDNKSGAGHNNPYTA